MRYDAFISYRHAPLDMEVAKKIHTGLETYKIPGAVQKKTGKKKMGRVFRDQEELPIGSDLDDNISTALAESQYLIVICSPRTPESYWVCKEIENFIKMHDRNHVLAVLIEGEPSESFPPQLLIDEEGNPVEPLAADVRGADKKERNAKYKTELLRLAAPVIGCTYDELRQRHKERVIKKTIALASSAAGVVAVSGMAFGLYNASVAEKMKQLADEKSRLADEITVQYKGKQENQSRFYAEESLSLLESGNREDAVLVAMKGLPSEEDDRPYVPEAEYALSKALYAYDSGNDMSFDRNLTHSLPISTMKRSDDASRLITTDTGNKVYVWNAEDWSQAVTIEPVVSEMNFYQSVEAADADATGVYVTTDESITKYDYDGNVIYKKELGGKLDSCEMCENNNRLLVICLDAIHILNATTGETIETVPNNTDVSFRDGGRYNTDTSTYITAHMSNETGNTYLSLLDTEKATCKDVMLSDGMMLDFCVTPKGNYAVLSCNADILKTGLTHASVDLIDKNGNLIWTKPIDAKVSNVLTFDAMIKAHEYPLGGTNNNDVIVIVESNVFTFDENTGDSKIEFNLPGGATMLALSVDIPYGRVGYREGGIDFVDFSSGRIHPEFSFDTNDSVKDAVLFKTGIVFDSYSSSDAHVISWHEAPDAEDYIMCDEEVKAYQVSGDSDYFVMGPSSSYGIISFYDKDGNVAYTFDQGESIEEVFFRDDKAYIQDTGCIWEVNVKDKSAEKITLADYNFKNNYYDMDISADGSIAVVFSSRDALVLDLKNRKSVVQIESESKLGSIVVAADNKNLYISEACDILYAFNSETGESVYFKDDKLRTVADSSDKNYMVLSPDGRYLAICCMDGTARVEDTETFETVAEIPMDSYLRKYIAFTSDGKHLVMQGDDYKVRIWDMDKNEIINSVDSNVVIRSIVCDEESNLMAACSGYGMFLYETKGYGCVASIDRGMIYLSDEDSILISSDKTEIKRTFYKSYEKLIEEAKKQFKDAVLSTEKQVKYNIN